MPILLRVGNVSKFKKNTFLLVKSWKIYLRELIAKIHNVISNKTFWTFIITSGTSATHAFFARCLQEPSEGNAIIIFMFKTWQLKQMEIKELAWDSHIVSKWQAKVKTQFYYICTPPTLHCYRILPKGKLRDLKLCIRKSNHCQPCNYSSYFKAGGKGQLPGRSNEVFPMPSPWHSTQSIHDCPLLPSAQTVFHGEPNGSMP